MAQKVITVCDRCGVAPMVVGIDLDVEHELTAEGDEMVERIKQVHYDLCVSCLAVWLKGLLPRLDPSVKRAWYEEMVYGR